MSHDQPVELGQDRRLVLARKPTEVGLFVEAPPRVRGTEAFDAAWDAWFSELATTAGLAAPFEPLMELWRTGNLLDSVAPDALVLVAPGANATR
jgi:hypothetical protein